MWSYLATVRRVANRSPETRSASQPQNQSQPFLVSQLRALFARLLPEHLRLQNFLLCQPGSGCTCHATLPPPQCFPVQSVWVRVEEAGLPPACFLLASG